MVCITGLGSKSFQSFIETLHHVQLKFEWEFSDRALEKWSPSIFLDIYPFIDIANWLFTPAYLVPSKNDSIQPPTNIDPKGLMALALAKSKMLYLPDNVVLYFKKLQTEDGVIL